MPATKDTLLLLLLLCQGGDVILCFCLSVISQNYTKSTWQITRKLGGRIGYESEKNSLNLDANLDQVVQQCECVFHHFSQRIIHGAWWKLNMFRGLTFMRIKFGVDPNKNDPLSSTCHCSKENLLLGGQEILKNTLLCIGSESVLILIYTKTLENTYHSSPHEHWASTCQSTQQLLEY